MQHNTSEAPTPLMGARGSDAGSGDDAPAAAAAHVGPAEQLAVASFAADAAAPQTQAAEPASGSVGIAPDGSTHVGPSAAITANDVQLPMPTADAQQPAAAPGGRPDTAAQGGQPDAPVQGPLPEPGSSPPEQKPARTAAHAPRPLGNVVIQTDEDAVRELRARQVHNTFPTWTASPL